MRRDKTKEFLRHDFTPEELAHKASTLAQACQRLTAAEEEKKAAASQFTERIATEKALIGKTSREMNQGWETRETDCLIKYNMPNAGMKTIVRADTDATVKTISMTSDEMQETLFQDPETSENPEKAIEDNVRNFFNLKPAEIKPAEPQELHGWAAGEWLVVAVSGEEAAEWMKQKGHPVEADFSWANPDSTIIDGLETFFGRPSLPLRAAITHMQSEGIAFPMLLKIPPSYLESLKKGKDPDKEPPPAADAPAEPAKGAKAARKPRTPKVTPPEPPAAPEKPKVDGEDDTLEPGE